MNFLGGDNWGGYGLPAPYDAGRSFGFGYGGTGYGMNGPGLYRQW
jgi:hypothetical protein